MEAIIHAAGKQYRVKKGQKLVLNKIDAEVNTDVGFDVLMTLDGDVSAVGAEAGKAKVLATVVKQYKGEKVVSRTYKRRKGFHKKRGHRQQLTELVIKDIVV